ncbi:hypothetical protein EC951288_3201, partial [Escherichia coli 95.1288]
MKITFRYKFNKVKFSNAFISIFFFIIIYTDQGIVKKYRLNKIF